MNRILVTGGTGPLGTAVVAQLQALQANVLAVSRNRPGTGTHDPGVIARPAPVPWQRVDLTTGEGLEEALRGVHTVLHLAGSMDKVHREPAEIVAARHLLNASQRAGIAHFICISIVGVDKIPYPYYQTKLRVEEMIARSGLPYTVLRATQFHSFMETFIEKMLRPPVGFVPKKLKFQPVQLEAVARRLVTVVQSQPEGKLLQMGGPAVLSLGEMADTWLAFQQRRKYVVGLPVVGSFMRALAQGHATCPEVTPQSDTWEQYLRKKHTQVLPATKIPVE